MDADKQEHAKAEAVKMRHLEKEKELIEKTKSEIELIARRQLQELVKWNPERNFIELELEICRRLNEIGALLLERLIPFLYGDGYEGARLDFEDKLSYRCEVMSKERKLRTVFGDIKISRAVYSEYYSGSYISFLDDRLNIDRKRTCPLLTYWSNLMGTIAPFDEAADILNKIRGIEISAKQIELSTESSAKDITGIQESKVKGILLDKNGKIEAANINLNLNAKRTVYIETDGCMINTNSDWKECKTFMLFELDKISETEHRLKNKFYYSTMGTIDDIKKQLKYNLERYCDKDEVKIVCVGDGAKWIWNMMEELFPKDILNSGAIEIIDWYHAIEKIGDIKEEVIKDAEEGRKFYEECKEYLAKGNIETVEQVLLQLRDKQTSLEKREFVDERLKYFVNNKEKMRYEKFKENGLCIGSGAIESANKYVIQRRLKQAGMKWNLENANYMAHLRTEYINKELDAYYGIVNNPLLGNIMLTAET